MSHCTAKNRLKPVICILLCWLCSLAVAEELDIRYELDLNFIPGDANNPAQVEGTNRVWIRNNSKNPLGEVYFHNSANGYYNPDDRASSRTTIENIRCSHLGKVTSTSEISMRVGLFPAVNPGEEVVLNIPFTTRISEQPSPFIPTVGNRADTTIYNLMFFYPVLEFFHPDGWHTWDHGGLADPYSNLAEYQVSLSYPVGYQIGTSANLVHSDTLTTELVRQKFTSAKAISFSAVVSTEFVKRSTVIAGIAIDFLYTPGEQSGADQVITRLKELIPFYQERFGDCPNDKLTLTMGYSLDAGAVASSNYIIFQGGFESGLRTLPHEFAHQWFGNAINADESYETWLIESFAEYAAGLFRKSRQTPAEFNVFKSTAAVVTIWRDLENLNAEEIMRRLYDLFGRSVVPPIYQPDKQTDWEDQAQLYSRYIVGNHALQMLESAVGDSLMQIIMHTYATENVWKTVNTETFISTVNRFVNHRIGDNFRLALTTNLRPDYKIVAVETKGRKDRRWDTKIITDFKGTWSLPVDFEAITEQHDTIRFTRIHLQNQNEINLISDNPVKSVLLDPDKRIFDSNRFNNRWPRTFLLQPIYGLPSWEVYKLYYRPVIRQDWRRDWRFGVHISGGLGLNLMPILPAFYQNAFDLELTYAPQLTAQQTGLKFAYRTPLGSVDRTFWEFRTSWEYPRNEQAMSLSRYVGKIRYLVANRQSAYQRLTGQIKRTEFATTDKNNRWFKGKLLSAQADFIRFRYNLQQRSNIRVALLAGQALQWQGGLFYRLSSLIDLERHLWDQLIVRAHGEHGLVWDDRISNYLRYRLQHQLRAWRPRTEFVPLFRGFTPVNDEYWDSVLGFGFSVGAETEWPVWPMVYIDAVLAEESGGDLAQRWRAMAENTIYASAGIGIESQSLVELGLYLPLWISHPIGGGSRWGWRWLVEWGFYF